MRIAPIKIKGTPFGQIDLTERIKQIRVLRGETRMDVDVYKYTGPFDYAALEKAYEFEPGDRVTLLIEDADGRVRSELGVVGL